MYILMIQYSQRLLQAAWSCMQCGIVSAIAGTAFAQSVAHGRQLPG